MEPRRRSILRPLGYLVLLGSLVGLACWPLNQVDLLQDRLLSSLPAFRGGGWSRLTVLLAMAPVVVLPLLLWLQRGPFRQGAGSGIPQVMACLEDSHRGADLLGWGATWKRVSLWTVASLALFPLGREGPVVEVGSAVGQALLKRWPGVMRRVSRSDLLAGAAGAGLAGGFNTPLMGVLFIVEELTGTFRARLIWPALLMASGAALLSNLGGQPMFALGINAISVAEGDQMFWAIPIGIGAGWLGGCFARLVVVATRSLFPLARRHPLALGLAGGIGLGVLALATGGASGGDGESLMRQILDRGEDNASLWSCLGLLLSRLVGPVLPLAMGVPGGLIDPSFTLGGLFGAEVLQAMGGDPHLGLALGMAAGLAGATQLPVMTIAFAVRMAGDQQLMAGLVASAVIGAYVGRLVQVRPVYHALTDLMRRNG